MFKFNRKTGAKEQQTRFKSDIFRQLYILLQKSGTAVAEEEEEGNEKPSQKEKKIQTLESNYNANS